MRRRRTKSPYLLLLISIKCVPRISGHLLLMSSSSLLRFLIISKRIDNLKGYLFGSVQILRDGNKIKKGIIKTHSNQYKRLSCRLSKTKLSEYRKDWFVYCLLLLARYCVFVHSLYQNVFNTRNKEDSGAL